MSPALKDRHLFGAAAGACAVCCAAPLLTVLGIAGAAATVATFVLAGAAFALVVALGAALALWRRRRAARPGACDTSPPPAGPVDIEIGAGPPARQPGPVSAARSS